MWRPEGERRPAAAIGDRESGLNIGRAGGLAGGGGVLAWMEKWADEGTTETEVGVRRAFRAAGCGRRGEIWRFSGRRGVPLQGELE